MARIPVSGPSITQKEIDAVTDAVRNAWYANANIYHDRFEKAFAHYVNVKHAVALPSCTSALHLALLALEVGAGDEVIVPDLTWIASAAPVTYVGAQTIFADVDPTTWCLSAESFRKNITERTRAVIPVDLYGNIGDMDAIREIAAAHGIAVIEDAAEAMGALYRGRKAGSLGDVGVFSFHGSKTMTTGEGGMLVTDSDDVYENVLHLRDHGRAPGSKMFWNTQVAHKYKMSAMQAALGLAQLERMDELLSLKREIFSWYQEELQDLVGITLNSEAADVRNAYWMVTVILDPQLGIGKELVLETMASRGVDCRPFFYPLSMLPAYQQSAPAHRARAENHTSYAISPWGVNLPSSLSITREEVTLVCNVLREILAVRRSKAA